MTIFGLAFFKNLMIILQIICTHVTKAFSFFCFALNSDSQQKIGFSNVTQVDTSLFCFQAFTHFLTQLFCRIKQYCICYSCCGEWQRLLSLLSDPSTHGQKQICSSQGLSSVLWVACCSQNPAELLRKKAQRR